MKKIATLFLLSVITLGSAFGQNWEKMVLGVDEPYYRGDYITAVKNNTKFAKKVTKKLGQNSDQYITYSLMAARNNLAQGLLKDFDLHIDKAVATSEVVHGPDSEAARSGRQPSDAGLNACKDLPCRDAAGHTAPKALRMKVYSSATS